MEKANLTQRDNQLLKAYQLEAQKLKNICVATYAPGEILFFEGTRNEYLFIITAGQAQVRTTATNGRDLILSYYIEKGLLGDMEMMSDSKKAYATVTAVTAVSCILIPYAKNMEIIKTNNCFMNILAKSLSDKLINSTNHFVLTTLYNGLQRVCSFIYQQAEEDVFQVNLTDMADTIGISYRQLHRLLKKLSEQKILKKSAKGYVILEKQKLWELSIE